MKIKANEVKKVTQVIRGATPTFVSMVEHGANQTPFVIVKANTIENKEQLIIDKAGQELIMKNENIEIRQFKFDSTKFTEEAASELIASYGIDDFSLETKDGFLQSVKKDTEEVFKESEIQIVEGVFLVIGEKEEKKEEKKRSRTVKTESKTEEKKEDSIEKTIPEKEEKKEEKDVIQKFNFWTSYLSEHTEFGEVLKAGDDGLPVGIYDITDVMMTAMKNAYQQNEPENIADIVQDYGKAMGYLYKLYSIFSAGEQKTVKKEDSPAVDTTAVLTEEISKKLEAMKKSSEELTETLLKRIETLESTFVSRHSRDIDETSKEVSDSTERLKKEQEDALFIQQKMLNSF